MATQKGKARERTSETHDDDEQREHPLSRKRRAAPADDVVAARLSDEHHEPTLSDKGSAGREARPTSDEIKRFAEEKYFVEPSEELKAKLDAEQARLAEGKPLHDVPPRASLPAESTPHVTRGARLNGVEQQRNVVQVVRSNRQRNHEPR